VLIEVSDFLSDRTAFGTNLGEEGRREEGRRDEVTAFHEEARRVN
jgi:hypothetical protein